MRLSALQIGMIIAGVMLVLGVIAFNRWQERRYRRRMDAELGPSTAPAATDDQRIEPTLAGGAASAAEPFAATAAAGSGAATAATARPEGVDGDEPHYRPPMDELPRVADADANAVPPDPAGPAASRAESGNGTARAAEPRGNPQPDPDIEAIITLQPTRGVRVGTIAAGLHPRLGKPVRWFGLPESGGPWQILAPDTPGEFVELAACMLLADRNGAASGDQVRAFVDLVGQIAPTLPAAFLPPDIEGEVARAEELDRLCADLDVQIGLTLLKAPPGAIAGTRLRGVAEAAGFRLAPGGRFEFLHEDAGTVEYSLQNLRNEPFTPDSLRLVGTNGIVFLLDVPRVTHPAQSFDRMKMIARRMAQNLGAELVDDNQRVLDDAALATIRAQVQGAADALVRMHIEPGSARALALFGS